METFMIIVAIIAFMMVITIFFYFSITIDRLNEQIRIYKDEVIFWENQNKEAEERIKQFANSLYDKITKN
jgi:uncharacterized protein YxeA